MNPWDVSVYEKTMRRIEAKIRELLSALESKQPDPALHIARALGVGCFWKMYLLTMEKIPEEMSLDFEGFLSTYY